MLTELEAIVRILASIVLGGLIGLERALTGHSAGLRTYMLITLGAALFMVGSELMTVRFATLTPAPDPTRVASTIVTGIGFLGAGVIFQSRNRIRNLTTAASIWVAAAIGMLTGAGLFVVAVGGTLITVVVLALLPRVEDWLARRLRRPMAALRPDVIGDELERDERDRD